MTGLPFDSPSEGCPQLRYLEGRTGAQLAQDLQIPLGTVKSRAGLAMRRLRAELI